MKEEIVVSLIMTGALSREQVEALVKQHQNDRKVFEAAISSGYYSDEKLLEILKNDPYDHHACFIWKRIVGNLKKKDPKEVWKMIKLFAERTRRNYDFVNLVDLTFDFSEPFTEAMKILKELIRISPGDKREIARLMLEKREFNKQELFAIGSFVKTGYIWEEIIIEKVGHAKLSKKEILLLLRKRSISVACYFELMKSKKAFSQKKIISLLRKITKGVYYSKMGDNVISLLIAEYKYDIHKFLKIARKVNTEGIWNTFQDKFSDKAHLLNKKDIRNILLKGNRGWRRFAISRLDTRTLIRIANPKNLEKSNPRLIGDIILSKRLSKKLSLKIARKINWSSIWGDLIQSGHFSDDEAIALIRKESVKYDLSQSWKYLCDHIDLSKRSSNELIEFGELADSDETWELIVAELNKRNKKKKDIK